MVTQPHIHSCMYALWMLDLFQRNLVKSFSGTIFYHSILTQPPPSTPVLSEPLLDHDLPPNPEERLCLNHLYLKCPAHGLPQSLPCVSLVARERGIEIFGSIELLGDMDGTLVYSGQMCELLNAFSILPFLQIVFCLLTDG